LIRFLIWNGVISYHLGQHLSLGYRAGLNVVQKSKSILAFAKNSTWISQLSSPHSGRSTNCAPINNSKENKLWLLALAGLA
jgi:abortive infection bacteriophage resistance protein